MHLSSIAVPRYCAVALYATSHGRDTAAQLNVKIGGMFRLTSAAMKRVRMRKGSHGFTSLDTYRVGQFPVSPRMPGTRCPKSSFVHNGKSASQEANYATC
jgi:hypothetical protein